MATGSATRRRALIAATSAATGMATLLAARSPVLAASAQPLKKLLPGGGAKEVGAIEDLMREHGVLRRIVFAYAQTAPKLRTDPSKIDPEALNAAAKLFRAFGEEYHERQLEETSVFPDVTKAGGPAAALPEALIQQHRRGSEITDYILETTAKGIGRDAEPLARALDGFATMYEIHTAKEDTLVFPAWRNSLSAAQLDAAANAFEDAERSRFGRDGFEDAVKKIGDLEGRLGLADLDRFTPPAPPTTKPAPH
jgi:hemerythrin-like domain-containing protein